MIAYCHHHCHYHEDRFENRVEGHADELGDPRENLYCRVRVEDYLGVEEILFAENSKDLHNIILV